ncbi:MAG TPA: efflux transporter outer membrane subunit [Caulobacteraceae bacterium]|jgi:NodT family efflux transporter outer membrane factor (OMF) lipoprotein
MLALVGGCTVGPRYSPPTTPVPPSFSGGPSAAAPDMADWWRAFDDPVLDDLVTRALASNLDVQQAVARIEQAREQERITRGGQGPQVNASAQGSQTTLSKNSLPSALAGLFSGGSGQPSSSGPGIGLPGETFTIYQLGFDASWELDPFGGQRRANEANRAQTEAAVWSARDADVTLTAEVANTYEQYRALQRRLALANEVLAGDREAIALAKARASNGLDDDANLQQQTRAAEQAAAQRTDLAAQADVRIHALGTLLAVAPNELAAELSQPPAGAPVLVDVPPGLPSELLQRRPDLRAAERRAAAATAEVGVATADLYPKISLTGALALASRSLSTILESQSLQDNVSGAVSIPVFNRGRLHAAVRQRQSQADEVIFAYRKSVLTALQDVEDALIRLRADRLRLTDLRASALAAQDQADSAAVRYHNGLTAAADVLAARQTWRTDADAEVQAEATAAQDMVALYKALGGGWDERRSNQGDEARARGS